MDDEDALKLVEGVVERIMARQHPGRPAYYALSEAHRAIRRAKQDIEVRTRGWDFDRGRAVG